MIRALVDLFSAAAGAACGHRPTPDPWRIVARHRAEIERLEAALRGVRAERDSLAVALRDALIDAEAAHAPLAAFAEASTAALAAQAAIDAALGADDPSRGGGITRCRCRMVPVYAPLAAFAEASTAALVAQAAIDAAVGVNE